MPLQRSVYPAPAGLRAASEPRQALAQPVAPVRQLGRALLRAQHRVRRPRRLRAELGRRDPADAAVEAGLLEDRLREVGPRAVAARRRRGRRRTAARRRPRSPRRGGRRRSGSRAGRRRPRPRRAPRRAAASCGRSCGPSGRRATRSGRSTPRSPAAASPCSFVRPYAPSGLGASDSRYGVALRAVEDVVGRVVDERRAELGGVLRAADVDRRRALRVVLGAVDVRPGRRVQHELDGRERRPARGKRDVPDSLAAQRSRARGTSRRARARAGRPRR